MPEAGVDCARAATCSFTLAAARGATMIVGSPFGAPLGSAALAAGAAASLLSASLITRSLRSLLSGCACRRGGLRLRLRALLLPVGDGGADGVLGQDRAVDLDRRGGGLPLVVGGLC